MRVWQQKRTLFFIQVLSALLLVMGYLNQIFLRLWDNYTAMKEHKRIRLTQFFIWELMPVHFSAFYCVAISAKKLGGVMDLDWRASSCFLECFNLHLLKKYLGQ